MYQQLRLEPYAVHTTFQYAGTEGKRHRLREAMVFYDPPEYYDAPGRTMPSLLVLPSSIGMHLFSWLLLWCIWDATSCWSTFLDLLQEVSCHLSHLSLRAYYSMGSIVLSHTLLLLITKYACFNLLQFTSGISFVIQVKFVDDTAKLSFSDKRNTDSTSNCFSFESHPGENNVYILLCSFVLRYIS